MGKEAAAQPSATPGKKDAEVEEIVDETPPPSTFERLRGLLGLISQAVKEKDTRALMGRVLRETAGIRSGFGSEVLIALISEVLPVASGARGILVEKLGQVSEVMDVDSNGAAMETSSSSPGLNVLPEVEMYCLLISQMYLVTCKEFQLGREVSDFAVTAIAKYNRRTLDQISARIYFYYSWIYESLGMLSEIRSTLLTRMQTAVLQHDDFGQETLLNLLLRNYLHYNLYDQAEKLRSKSPEPSRASTQICRYLYYWGRIRAIQLEYTDARDCLQQAIRKAPNSAHGFRITVSKWLIIVSLLLGEIPEMTEFTQQGMKKALEPYFQLARAVRSGDLASFRAVAEQFHTDFRADKTHNLISRLHHNVLRTGLRRINLAYSKISLKDVAAKLGLGGDDAIERIVAKAIHDGGMDATIDHENQCLKSVEVADVYSTQEPQKAFHARIAFCLDIHNEAVKAMRFDPDAHKKPLEDAEARKERLAQEQELAKAIQEEEDDEF
ncbi:hypothetical protein BSKO_08768 [Bryopsis sp. KO-2023]|nr:hypothetical protein BSKO_08768 [Bryopsis sp. KO-2023]